MRRAESHISKPNVAPRLKPSADEDREAVAGDDLDAGAVGFDLEVFSGGGVKRERGVRLRTPCDDVGRLALRNRPQRGQKTDDK